MPSSDDPPLTPELVLAAYGRGWFPMADSRQGRIGWCSPDERAILPLDRFHIPHGLKRAMAKKPYRLTIDQAFESVIRACAQPRSYADETWINEAIIQTYTQLHRMGFGHSIEAWDGDRLVGGLYGLAIGRAFFGESMFSRQPDASKICLVHLVDHLKQRGFVLLDAQLPNPHLEQFGLQVIPKRAFLRQLSLALCPPLNQDRDTTCDHPLLFLF